MALMTCPRCGGCGEIAQGANTASGGIFKTVCPSCRGFGYVTDSSIQVNIRCPKCGIELKPHICGE